MYKLKLISICVMVLLLRTFNSFAEDPKDGGPADEKGRLDKFENVYRYSLTEEQKQGLLNKRKEKAKKEQEIAETNGRSYTAGDFFSDILGELVGEIFSDVLSLPYYIVESLPSEGFTPYPYALRKEVPDYQKHRKPQRHYFSAQIQKVSDQIRAGSLEYNLNFKDRIGFDIDWSKYSEDLGHTQSALEMTKINLRGNFYQKESSIGFFGMGIRRLKGQEDNIGFDFGLGFIYFPLKPLRIDGSINYASINKQDLFDLRAGIGILVNRFETKIGYRSLQNKADQLNGPYISLGVWF